MPGTRTDFGQMYDHELNPYRGWSGDRGVVLEKALAISDENSNKIYAGCCVYVDPNNKFRLGIRDTGSTASTRVPCFAFQNEDDFDVNSDLGNISGGVLMALCALGDFELETTQFDTGSGEDYTPGTLLTATAADAEGGANSSDGNLLPGDIGTDPIVGIISEQGTNSDHSFENEHGQNVIRFWSWFFPVTIA